MGLIRRAMALRVKYRVSTGKSPRQMIPLSLLGVHPQNRGGVYPQGETVMHLGWSIFKAGFSTEEGNHEGVCVQEKPAVAGTEGPPDGYTSLSTWNTQSVRSAALLKKSFLNSPTISHGTLSHSHLLLVLLSFREGAAWEPPDAHCAKAMGPTGHLSLEAAVAVDPELGTMVRDGLAMEVLSWKIMEDEPDGCSLISQALNKGHQLALRTTELTAVSVLSGHISRFQGDLDAAVVKERLRQELDTFVDEPEFLDVFEFVVNLGAAKGGFVQSLLDFGGRFVDSKQRQLRLVTFAQANQLPLETPRSKIAALMRAYRKNPTRGYCPTLENCWVMARNRDSLLALEQLLHYLVFTCKPAVAGMDADKRQALHANIMCVSAEAFAKCSEPGYAGGGGSSKGDIHKCLLEATLKFYHEMEKFGSEQDPAVPMPRGDTRWLNGWDKVAAPKPAVAGSSPEAKLSPKVIEYDPSTGQPLTRQDTRKATEADAAGRQMEVPWREWAESAPARDLGKEASDQAAVLLVLRSLAAGSLENAKVKILIDPEKKSKVVTASEDMEANALELWPLVPSASRVYARCLDPRRVRVTVCPRSADEETQKAAVAATYYLVPEFKLPALEAVDDEEEGSVWGSWQWTGQESLWPFWAVGRETSAELKKRRLADPTCDLKINVMLAEREFSAVTVGRSGGTSCAITRQVTVPCLTNPEPLKKGETLLWQLPEKPANPKARELTWKDDLAAKARASAKNTAKADAGKAKKRARPSGAMEVDDEV